MNIRLRFQPRPLRRSPARPLRKPPTPRRETALRETAAPAGRFETEVWTAATKDGPACTFFVEKASPHRIVKCESSDGEKAELTGENRLKYWDLRPL